MNPSARPILVAAAAGLLFGGGLAISGMMNPARVAGFLDVAGAWDPTLIFVMAGALMVSLPGFQFARRASGGLFEPGFLKLPTRSDIDPPLVIGAAIFGLGWGITGFCPGPAVSALSTAAQPVLLFFVAMAFGMGLHRLFLRLRGGG